MAKDRELFITEAKKKPALKQFTADWKEASRRVKNKKQRKKEYELQKLELEAKEAEVYLQKVKARDKAKKLIKEAKHERWRRSWLHKLLKWLFSKRSKNR